MSFYPYEYFCGANVVVEIEGQPLHECAGITYNVQESKAPLYGYSSRHFNAVGRGQVIVTGNIIVNYIHQDYLFRSIETGVEFKQPEYSVDDAPVVDFLTDNTNKTSINEEINTDPGSNLDLIRALQSKYWSANPPKDTEGKNLFQPEIVDIYNSVPNPHDISRAVDIKITFGSRNPFNSYNGVTAVLLSGVYLVGRGVPIRIDEEVIVEEYSFFARNIHTIKSNTRTISALFEDGPGEITYSLGTTTNARDIRAFPEHDVTRPRLKGNNSDYFNTQRSLETIIP